MIGYPGLPAVYTAAHRSDYRGKPYPGARASEIDRRLQLMPLL